MKKKIFLFVFILVLVPALSGFAVQEPAETPASAEAENSIALEAGGEKGKTTLEMLHADALPPGDYALRLIVVRWDGNYVGEPHTLFDQVSAGQPGIYIVIPG